MARTSAAAIKLLMAPGGDYDTVNNPDVAPFIDSASHVVDGIVLCVARRGLTALSSTELELIERWLAAHLYCMSDQTYTSKSNMSASGSFRPGGGLNLDGSPYGQTAKLMDSSGCLTSMGTRARAGLRWAGKPPSEQTDYVDRD